MVIRSKFKDYYDFVATKYGGGDPRTVYNRGRIKETTIEVDLPKGLADPASLGRFYGYHQPGIPDLIYHYLVITGKIYLLAKPRPGVFKTSNVNDFRVIDPKKETLPRWVIIREEIVFGQEYEQLVNMCRVLHAPVFVISSIKYYHRKSHYVNICEQCPILGDIGMAARVDPHQMYQDIAVFMGNRMSKTPDVQPPVELSNKQKIIKAGFDLVRSFRH